MTPERWQRVKAVFQTVWERPPAEREACLESKSTGDAELRREVEKMLRHAGGAGPLDTPACTALRGDRELQPGSCLGPYEIVEQAGAGGMGRVYKARDTRLGRTVAIKVLSAEFSHRLRTEGRAVSALNHPHVCALYDIDDREGYLVMEYVEGESLAARLAIASLPHDVVLVYGTQIAGALAAAHAHGIVHRDLKPANIMITASGVKVLDFGVARVVAEEDPSAGGVAGTMAYMSPSQLNGNPADARSDIFALGLVLYEMATGNRHSRIPFERPANLPAGLAGVIDRCLRPDAASRFQTMNEVRAALEQLRAESAPPRSGRSSKQLRIAALVVAVAASSIVTWKFARPDSPAPQSPAPKPDGVRPVAQSMGPPRERAEPTQTKAEPRPKPVAQPPSVPPEPPSLVTLASYPGMERDASFSPDGRRVAFSWEPPGRHGFGIYVRPVNGETEPAPLTGGASEDWGPAWSPNGQTIAFRRKAAQQWGIYTVKASGGAESLIAPIASQHQETLPQMSWSHDGKCVAAPDRDSYGVTQIYLFNARSGEKRALTSSTAGTNHAPAFSPDGKSLAYASCAGTVNPCDLYILDLGRDLVPKRRRQITEQGVYVRGLAWLPNGRDLIYSAGSSPGRGTSLWRVSVDPPSLPVRIDMAGSQARHPTVSPAGGLLAYTRLNGWNLMMIRNYR